MGVTSDDGIAVEVVDDGLPGVVIDIFVDLELVTYELGVLIETPEVAAVL